MRALFIAEDLNNNDEQIDTYIKLAKIYSLNDEYNKALKNLSEAIDIADTSKEWQMKIYHELGIVQSKHGFYSDAISNLFKSTYLAESLKNSEYKTANNKAIANIFYNLGEYDQALKYYLASIDTSSNDTIKQIELYIFIGENYLKLGKPIEALEYGLKANKSFNLFNENKKTPINYKTAAQIKILLGKIYLQLDHLQEAQEEAFKALLMSRKTDDTKLKIEANRLVGEYYKATNENKQAVYYLSNALAMAKNNRFYALESELAMALYDFYKKNKNYRQALLFLEEAFDANKKIEIIKAGLLANKINVEQQYGKTEKIFEQEVKNLTSQKRQLRKYLILISSLFVLLLILFIFFLQKLRIIRRQKNLIEKQKSIILKQYEKHKLLSFVASHTDNSIFIMNTKGKVIWINEALLKLYNTTRHKIFEEYKGDYRKLTHYDADKVFETCINERKSITYVSEIDLKTKKIWVQTTVSPIIEGNEVTKMIGIESDITELKKAEELLQKQKKDIEFKTKLLEIYNQELKQQKEAIVAQNEELQQQQEELKAHMQLLEEYNKELKRLSTIVEETDNIIFTFDVTGKFRWVNEAFTKHTGYTLEEFIEEFGDNLLNMSTKDDIAYYFYACLENKRSVKYVSKFKTKYGKEMWFQTTLTPILDKDGNIEEIVAIDADITEMKKAEQKIYNQNIEIKSTLEYASKIQQAVLPARIFINAIFEKNSIYNKPKDFVSGDFYFLHYANDYAILAVADSTGHGIPGAFMSLLGTMALRIVMTKTKFYNPNIILNMLNDELVKLLHQYEQKRETIESIDIALCVFNFKTNTLEYAGANIPLYIMRKNSKDLIRIKPNKTTIGYSFVRETFTVHSLTLNEGDRIYLASDGIADQFGGEDNKKMKRKGFVKLLKHLNNTPIDKVEDEMEDFMHRWMGNNDQVDDMLLFIVEY